MLGAFLNSGPAVRAEDLCPGWVAVRRSMIIALCVGSTIIILNHGDGLLAGAITPPSGGENACDALCTILCVVLRRLCRLSAGTGRAAARGRHGIGPPGGICQ